MQPIHYLMGFSFLNHTALAGARVLVALHAVFLGASPGLVGLLVALFAAIPMVSSVQVGRMIDRQRARGPVVIFALLTTAGAMASYFWQHTTALFITGLVMGGAYMAINIIVSSLAGRTGHPSQRAANFSWVGLGIAAANGLGPLLAGLAIDHIGFRSAVLCVAALPLLSLIPVALGKVPEIDTQPPARKPGSKRGRVTDLLLHKDMRPVYLTGVFFMLAWDIFLVMTPVYGAQLEISATHIGIIVSSFSIAVFAVRVFTGPVTRTWTPWQILLLSLGLSGIAMVAYGLVTAVPLLILCAFALGAGQGFGTPMAQTALFECSPPERTSEAMGLRLTVGMACQFVLPLIAGAAASLVGVAPLFWLVGVLILAYGWMQRARWHSRVGTGRR